MSPGQHGKRVPALAWTLLGLVLAACAGLPPQEASQSHWVASWGTAQIVSDNANLLPPERWRDASLRQVVHLSLIHI